MAMAEESPSTRKRVKLSYSCSNSMAFSLSPLGMSKADAIAAKMRDPAYTELRAISIAPLSTKEAREEQAEGYTICLTPFGTHSNKWYSDLGKQYHLYVTLLGLSPKVCEVDLVAFVLKHLDYFLKQVVRESLDKSAEEFEEALLGPHKEKPFQSFNGNNLRYSALLLFVDRMKTKVMDADEAARFDLYDKLLLACENKLLESLEVCGAAHTEDEKIKLVQVIREELVDFLLGEIKGDRDIASHVFCDLLWVDTKSPLHEQDLASPHAPGV